MCKEKEKWWVLGYRGILEVKNVRECYLGFVKCAKRYIPQRKRGEKDNMTYISATAAR